MVKLEANFAKIPTEFCSKINFTETTRLIRTPYLPPLAQGIVGQSDLVEADGPLHPPVARSRRFWVEVEAGRRPRFCSAAPAPYPIPPLVAVLTLGHGLDTQGVETVRIQSGEGNQELWEHAPDGKRSEIDSSMRPNTLQCFYVLFLHTLYITC